MSNRTMERAKAFLKISPADTDVYTPPGHDDTYNRRFIGWASGSPNVEIILGEMGPKGTADDHIHENFDQVLYMIEGTLKVISGSIEEELNPGDLGYIPMNVAHQVFCESGRAKFLVIYSPPRDKFDGK